MSESQSQSSDFGFGEHSAAAVGKPYARLPDESRIPVIVSAVYVVGNEEIKKASGGTQTRFAIALQFDSLINLRYDDGSLVDPPAKHSWLTVCSFSYHENARLTMLGIPAALGLDGKDTTLRHFISTALGAQVSARIKWRQYTDQQNLKKIATDLEAYKPVVDKVDFSETISLYRPHRQIVRRNPECKFVHVGMMARGDVRAMVLADWGKPVPEKIV